MRTTQFAHNEYYHVCGRGLDRQVLFKEPADWARFLFLLLYLQSPIQLFNISKYTDSFLKHGKFTVGEAKMEQLLKKRYLELLSFALMPNHFHVLIRNVSEGAISVYMHRVLMAYAKYFNAKYERFGHVFDGPFRSIHVKNNEQLLYTSSYIHKNPNSLPDFAHSYDVYPYSSYQDYINVNRWGDLLARDLLLGQFKNPSGLKHFTETSKAKDQNEVFFDF